MSWQVLFPPEFDPEFEELDEETQDELLAQLTVLQKFGPSLGRPKVDTLNNSKHANMKELRFRQRDGVWRFAFAFDPERRAIGLCGGDKGGKNEKRFYRDLIATADARDERHLKETGNA